MAERDKRSTDEINMDGPKLALIEILIGIRLINDNKSIEKFAFWESFHITGHEGQL